MILKRDDDGFTLIEVLVAFVVLALALSGVYATLANSARMQSELALRDSVMAEAQSLLDRFVAGPLTAGESDGRFVSGAQWRTVVTPLPTYTTVPSVTAQPASVALIVSDGRGRTLARFDTVAFVRGGS